MPRITKRLVESLIPPATGQKIYRDSDTFGFCLRMAPTCRAFIIEVAHQGKRRRITIGHYPAMSVEQARAEAQKQIAELKLGIEPGERKAAPTLAEALEHFLNERPLSPKSIDTYRRIIHRALPDWLALPITAIDKNMIRERHKALVKPTRCGSDNKSDADRAFHTLRVVLNFAKHSYEIKGKPLLEENPVSAGLRWRWYGTNVRTGIIPDHKLSEFYQAVMKQPNKSARDFIFLLLFTGLRRNEVATLKWTDIDFEKLTLSISPGFNKSKREHILPLTDILSAILKSRKLTGVDSNFVFPGRPDANCKTGRPGGKLQGNRFRHWSRSCKNTLRKRSCAKALKSTMKKHLGWILMTGLVCL